MFDDIGSMIEQFGTWIQLGFLGIMVIFVGLGVLLGMSRGWKKATLAMGMTVASIILAVIFAPVLYKAVLKFDVSRFNWGFMNGEKNLQDLAVSTVNANLLGNPDLPLDVQPDAALIKFIIMLPSIFINLFTFFIFFLLFSLLTRVVVYPILKLFLLKKDRQAKRGGSMDRGEQKKKKRRFIGMGIGAAQGLAITLALLIPFAAVSNTAHKMRKELNIESYAALKADDGDLYGQLEGLDKILEQIAGLYRKSVPGAIFSTFGLDAAIYGSLTTVRVNEGGVKAKASLKDIVELIGSANIALKFMDAQKKADAVMAGSKTDAEKKTESIKIYDDFLKEVEKFIKATFTNDLFKSVFDGAVRSVDMKGPNIAKTEIGGFVANMAFGYMADENEDDEKTGGMGDILGGEAANMAVKSIFGEIKTDPSKKFMNELLGFVSIAKDVNNSGLLHDVLNNSLFSGDEKAGFTDILDMVEPIMGTLKNNLKNNETFLLREALVLMRNMVVDMVDADAGIEYMERAGAKGLTDAEWATEAEDLFGETGAFGAVIKNYDVIIVDGQPNFENALSAANESKVIALGGAIDSLFKTKLFGGIKKPLYDQYLVGMLAGDGAMGAIDMSKVRIEKIKFASLLPVMFRAFDLFTGYEELMGDERDSIGDKFGGFIETARNYLEYDADYPGERDPSGIIAQFSRMTESIFSGMNLSPKINEGYFEDEDNQIDIVADKVPIVELIKLSGRTDKMADIVASTRSGDPGALGQSYSQIEEMEEIFTRLDDALDQGTQAFRRMTEHIINSLMNREYANPIESFKNSCKAYKTMIKLAEPMGEAIGTAEIGELVEILVADDDVFEFALEALENGSIVIPEDAVGDANKADIEQQLIDKGWVNDPGSSDPEQIKLNKIAELLGII